MAGPYEWKKKTVMVKKEDRTKLRRNQRFKKVKKTVYYKQEKKMGQRFKNKYTGQQGGYVSRYGPTPTYITRGDHKRREEAERKKGPKRKPMEEKSPNTVSQDILLYLCGNPCCLVPNHDLVWQSGLCCPVATCDREGCIDACCCLAAMLNPLIPLCCIMQDEKHNNGDGQAVAILASIACFPMVFFSGCSLSHERLVLAQQHGFTSLGEHGDWVSLILSCCCCPCWPSLAVAQAQRELRVRMELPYSTVFRICSCCCGDIFGEGERARELEWDRRTYPNQPAMNDGEARNTRGTAEGSKHSKNDSSTAGGRETSIDRGEGQAGTSDVLKSDEPRKGGIVEHNSNGLSDVVSLQENAGSTDVNNPN
eukprot:jgi/Bigna1/83280/fgenesh1_pg.105_\